MAVHILAPAFRREAARAALASAGLWIGAAGLLHAQEAAPRRLTLPDALALAEQRGYDFLLADAAARGAAGDLTAARRLTNPLFSGAYLHSTDVPAGDTTTSANGYSLSLSDQGVIEGAVSGKRGLRVRVAEAALAQARAGRDDALRVLRLQVTQGFYGVLAAEAAERVSREVAGTFAQTLELVQVRYQHGAVSEVDVARVDTAKLEAEQTVTAAAGQVAQTRAALAFLLGGIAPDYELVGSLEGPVETWPSADPKALVAEALSRRADVQAARAALDRADAALSLARRQRLPDIALSGGYTREGPDEAPVTPPTVSLGGTLELPVFNQRQGEIARAESDRSATKIAFDRTVSQATSDVRGGRAAYLAAREQVERMTGGLLDRARRARELVRVQYRAGAISLLDLLDAERTALAVELEYRQDLYALRTATAQLAAAIGREQAP